MHFQRVFGRLSVLRRNYCRNLVNQIQELLKNEKQPKQIQNIATIKREDDGSAVVIRFTYTNDAIQFRKPIKFVRKPDEAIHFSMERMKAKIIDKIARKCEKKGLAVPRDSLVVKLDGVNVAHVNWNELLDNFSEHESNLVLKVNDAIYSIEYNPPTIKLIELPLRVYPGFDCYPSQWDLCGDLSRCTFEWKRKCASSKEWVPFENENSFIYRVKEDDIGCELRLKCSVTSKNGVVIVNRSSNVTRVIGHGPNMKAIKRRHKHTPHTLPDHQFRVVTYNLLADFYTDTEYSRTKLFPYCSPTFLNIEFRKALFIRELLGYHCDVMCLQEVDKCIFEHDFHHVFGRSHLEGVYATKGTLPEGLATFYNSNKFSLISDHCVVLSDVIVSDPIHQTLYQRVLANQELWERMQPLRNFVQILVLHCKSLDRYLVVANTHLYSQPNADNIRLLQAAIILNQIQSVMRGTIVEHNLKEHQVSTVFCGDFNSEPSDSIHQLVIHGTARWPPDSTGLQDYIRRAFDLLTGKRNSGILSVEKSFQFQSAYENAEHTIYTALFTSCVDYMYYPSDRQKLIQTVPLPTTNELREHTGLPSGKFPSDHLALVSDFEWIQNSNS